MTFSRTEFMNSQIYKSKCEEGLRRYRKFKNLTRVWNLFQRKVVRMLGGGRIQGREKDFKEWGFLLLNCKQFFFEINPHLLH